MHWETGDCALEDCGLCIGRLGTVHWEAGDCALGGWEAVDCALGGWGQPDYALRAGDCLSMHWEAGTCGCALKTLEAGDRLCIGSLGGWQRRWNDRGGEGRGWHERLAVA